MASGKILFVLAAATLTFPAAASITVLGSSSARLCYEAAESSMTPDQRAIQRCDQALAEEPLSRYDTVATHVNRGILRARRGDVEGAISDFDNAIAHDPQQPESYLNKASVLLRSPGNAETALALFNVAIERKTKWPARAYYGRAVAYEDLGKLSAAYADYQRASQADPEWGMPQAELARFSVVRK